MSLTNGKEILPSVTSMKLYVADAVVTATEMFQASATTRLVI
jgi:hypothetical protein